MVFCGARGWVVLLCLPELVLWAFSSSSGDVAGTAQQKTCSASSIQAGGSFAQPLSKILKKGKTREQKLSRRAEDQSQ